uniref:Density-regulated protein n=1 Tax=Caenorhabditis japonica TaxID=281687 RepID=A0A8R1DSD3_CAEJA
MPLEYCDYSGQTDLCRAWATQNAPELLEGLNIADDVAEGGDEKKKQKRGGKGSKGAAAASAGAKKKSGVQKVTLQREPRGKKSVTVIKGLATFEIDLKVASKLFAQKFACGSSVTGADEIVIQGDVKDDLLDLIPEKWSQVTDELIDDLGDKKR